MKLVILDGTKIFSRAQLHDALQQVLELPEWYGRNLDALFDCLSTLSEPVQLSLQGRLALRVQLGRYAETLERVLQRAAQENENIQLQLQSYKIEK